jgi:hypothetical protein
VSHTNFLGIPVDGDIQKAGKRTAQRPLAELEPLLRAVLDDEVIVEFGWTQYTPYFNDGDPCVFSVGELWFRTTNDEKTEDEEYEYDLELSGGHPSLGERPRTYNRETRGFDVGAYVGEREASYDRCRELSEAVETGAFEDVLLDAFGDHARVVVSRDGITVDFYDHD